MRFLLYFIKVFYVMFNSKKSDHKSSAGFTLIELLNVIVIIGIVSGVGIPKFSQYKNKAYDIHAKRALKDIHLLCNAFWIDTYPSQTCDLPTIEGTYYGFTPNPAVLASLPPASSDTFCATAKHDSSPNVFSINNASLISSGEKCGVSIVNASFPPRPAFICSGTFQDPCPTIACDEECTKQKVQDRLLAVLNELPDLMRPSSVALEDSIQEIQSRTYSANSDGTPTMTENSSVNELLAATMAQPPSPLGTFEDYQPPENACSGNGSWTAVDSDGKKVENAGWMVCGCSVCGPGGGFYREDGIATQPRPNNYKYVFGRPANPVTGNVVGLSNEATRYNFATGMWCDDDNTRCEDYSENSG